jgi:cell division protein FtsB
MYNQILQQINEPTFIVYTLDFIFFVIIASFMLNRAFKKSLKASYKIVLQVQEESKEREHKNFQYLHANLLRLEERVNSLENKPKRKYIRKEKKDESL